MQPSDDKGWNPYMAGALAGLLSVLSVWAAGKFFGASTTFVRAAGLLERFVHPARVARLEYFAKEIPAIDWQWMFVLGIFFGSLLAAKLGQSFRWQALPPMWEARFGSGRGKRALAAFGGGVIAMFGARLADGLPSGHGLSGSLQLAVSGFIALAGFFLGGMLVARLLYSGSDHP